MIGLVLSLVLHKIPGALHVAYLFGTLAGFCAIGIYSLAYIPYVIPVVIIALIGWGIYNIVKSKNEKKEDAEIIEELATHFEDEQGEDKLSHKARNIQLIHRRKGVKKGG